MYPIHHSMAGERGGGLSQLHHSRFIQHKSYTTTIFSLIYWLAPSRFVTSQNIACEFCELELELIYWKLYLLFCTMMAFEAEKYFCIESQSYIQG